MSRQRCEKHDSSEIRNSVKAKPKLNLPGLIDDTAKASQETTVRFKSKDS
jgi:hypothetical protein